MGFIQDGATGQRHPLAARTMLGRANGCLVRVDHKFVSREHAVIEYVDGMYYVKDLSANGVTVDGKAAERGALTVLKPGAVLTLGSGRDVPKFELVDTSPPKLVAHEIDSHRTLAARVGEILRLPGSEDDEQESWVEAGCDERLGPFMFRGEHSDWVERLDNEQIIRVGSLLWMVHLPSDDDRTARAGEMPIDLGQSTLKLLTDEGHELVEVRLNAKTQILGVQARERTIVSRSRYGETLLALALKKQADLDDGVPQHQAGWVTNDELLALVGSRPGRDENLPYLHPFRLKRLFEAANVRGTSGLFQRDKGSIRLAVSDFEVVVTDEIL